MGHVVEVKHIAEDEHGGEGGPQQRNKARVGREIAGKADRLVVKVFVQQRVEVAVKDPYGGQH